MCKSNAKENSLWRHGNNPFLYCYYRPKSSASKIEMMKNILTVGRYFSPWWWWWWCGDARLFGSLYTLSLSISLYLSIYYEQIPFCGRRQKSFLSWPSPKQKNKPIVAEAFLSICHGNGSQLLATCCTVGFVSIFIFISLSPSFFRNKKKREFFFFWIWIVFVRVFMFGSLLETTTRFLPSFLVDIINEYSVVGTPFVGVQFLFYFQNKSQAVIVQRHIYIIYIEKNHWNAIVWSPSRPSPEIRETGFFWFCLWLSSYRGKARKPNSIIFLLYRILLLPSFFSFFPKLNGLYVRQQEMRAKAETKFDFGAFESSLNSTSQRHFASSVVVVFLSHHLFFLSLLLSFEGDGR